MKQWHFIQQGYLAIIGHWCHYTAIGSLSRCLMTGLVMNSCITVVKFPQNAVNLVQLNLFCDAVYLQVTAYL